LIKRIIPFLSPDIKSDKKFKQSIKQVIGSKPKNPELYRQALMHSSKATREKLPHNERLEFLGDAVLGFMVAEYLFKKYPTKNEGFLTQLRSKIVNRNQLHTLAVKMGIDELLTSALTKAEKNNSSACGDAFEAFIGAMYLDLGYRKTRDFLTKKVFYFIQIEDLANQDFDFKSKLQIYCQKQKAPFQYMVESISNGKQGVLYRVEVEVNGIIYGPFEHKSKKIAEQKVAEIAFQEINNG